MTWTFFPCVIWKWQGEKKHKRRKYIQTYTVYKQVRAHAERRSTDIAKPPCLASQPEIVDTFAKVRCTLRQGFVGRFFYLLIGSRKWMLWENICGRECGELSRTAWTHGLGLQAEGGWVGGGAEGQQASARRGFKKAEPGVWWAEWCMFFPPFPSAPACFA